MRQRLVTGIGMVLMAACASAQTRTAVHPGKVQIRSSAADALVVTGGVQAGGLATGTTTTSGLRIATGAIAAEGAAVAAPAGFTVHGSSSSPDWAQFVFGDGSGYRLNFGTRSGGNFATRFQVWDNGSIRVPNGTAAAPSVTFISDSDTGMAMPGGNGGDLHLVQGGVTVASLRSPATNNGNLLTVAEAAAGTGTATGAVLTVGRNTSGTGAPGAIQFMADNGSGWFIWSTSSGEIRWASAPPGENQDPGTVGSPVGTQTSTRAAKHINARVDPLVGGRVALDEIRRTPIFAFTYKDGRSRGETFYGITTEDSPLFGMDGGTSFNPVTSFGVTVLAIQELERRVRALEAGR